ncbi:MAG: hypothetical protein JGK12_27505 [Microcoleus sp. PH2017_01_SCD_O_A]|jgi:hypothetical protein|nr:MULTISPECIES: hypothetical protein [unclassified Microcoleus]MCC3427561.1 hypothetical protein [Microcoleus sp. PH2017_01_SCD_O_A]MCC3569069.1 hypothetical protein [Microcoleus sp. PH2017_31_RDM_U_A]MCC3581361.1 hypothetical protein [Microcoleus sp. PH2017_32_RDM_D_A]MCC3619374.1 hypothetical protein [Microcoleus sp. PH2017_38_RDM_U_B]
MLDLFDAGVGGGGKFYTYVRKKKVSAQNYLVLTTKNPWLNLVGGG